MLGLYAEKDMVVKAADVRRMGILQGKVVGAIIREQISGESDCPRLPLKCCFMANS